MPRYAYERLSAQDYSFLLAENENAPMHVSAIGILEAEALRNPEGEIDIARFSGAIESILHWIPRYRQKLAWIPVENWPTWIDDRHFDLGYHIRHIALPAPGTREQLREIAGRIFSRLLDRQRPLWELWVIEGLEKGEQVAILNKIHHCMMDGAAGADLTQILFSPSPQYEERKPVPYYPRPAPTGLELLSDRLRESLSLPQHALATVQRFVGAEREAMLDDLVARARALGELASLAFQPASDSPINGVALAVDRGFARGLEGEARELGQRSRSCGQIVEQRLPLVSGEPLHPQHLLRAAERLANPIRDELDARRRGPRVVGQGLARFVLLRGRRGPSSGRRPRRRRSCSGGSCSGSRPARPSRALRSPRSPRAAAADRVGGRRSGP